MNSGKKLKTGRKLETGRKLGGDDIAIGARLRVARLAAGMSQSILAKQLGVSFQQIQKYEKGTNRLSGGTVMAVCKALKLEPNYLLGWNSTVKIDEEISVSAIRIALLFNAIDEQYHAPILTLIHSLGVITNGKKKTGRLRR
jgi:transcriptional regulator with XRE-family HTH domain